MDRNLKSLELSLTMGCSLDCVYCPQGVLLKQYYKDNKNRKHLLSFEDFKQAINEAQAGGSISFSGTSEPFHNRKLRI